MNTVVTSKEDILKTSRELIQQQGWSALNIRSVAAACGVSVGAIYNYFDSKAALVGAAVESIWHEIFHRPGDRDVFQDTQDCIVWMYEQMKYGCKQYPGFFTLHSLGFMQQDKADGKRRMQQTWQHIQFTVEKFADVLFSQMLSALLRQDYDSAAVQELIRRTLY